MIKVCIADDHAVVRQGIKQILSGTPDQLIDTAKLYEQAGVDLLLCLVNPYKVPHDKVMQTIELMGKHVIPEFKGS